jgi:hypothetical protein
LCGKIGKIVQNSPISVKKNLYFPLQTFFLLHTSNGLCIDTYIHTHVCIDVFMCMYSESARRHRVDTCQREPRLDRMRGKGTQTHTHTHTHTHTLFGPVNESRVLMGCLVRVLRISFMGLLMSIFTTLSDNLSADTSGKYFEGSVSSCIFIFKRDMIFFSNILFKQIYIYIYIYISYIYIYVYVFKSACN